MATINVCIATMVFGAMNLFASSGYSGLEVEGTGKNQRLVVDEFPLEQRERYVLFSQKCAKCHALSRPVEALVDGKTPLTKTDFDKRYIKKYVIKMMRKANSGIAKQDAREIIFFLNYAQALARTD